MDNDQATLSAPEASTPEPSMRDTMMATLRGITERDGSATPDDDDAGSAVDKPRTPDGRFTAAAAQAEASAVPDATPAPEATAAPAPEPAKHINPPSSWTAAAKAEFAKASPIVQQEVLRREQQMHDGIAQYREAANYGQSLQKVIAPYEQTIRSLGVEPATAIDALLKADHTLRSGSPAEKMQTFMSIAQNYGIDLSQGLPQPQQVDPNVQYLQTELQTTKQQLQQFLSAQQQREEAELNSQIQKAAEGKDYFDQVRNEMAALLQAGTAKDIDEAYNMAIWAKPDLREALLAKQLEEKLAAETAKRNEEAKKAQAAAQAAKAASATNVPRRGTLPPQRTQGSMRDTMMETLQRIKSA